MNLGDLFSGWKRPTGTLSGKSRMTPVLPPRLALLEMGLLLALVLAEYAIEGFPQLTRMNPHPYWIAVLLLSLQYGTVSGLVAASIAIAGTVLIGLPEPDIEERYFNYLVRVWTQPVLWLLVALLLGSFRARQIDQREALLQQVRNLRDRGTTLLDHVNNLQARCTKLERHIATRPRSDSGQLLTALGRLSEAEPGRWAPALKTALASGFPGGRIALYAADGDRMRLLLAYDGDNGDGGEIGAGSSYLAPELTPGSPLLAAVVGSGRGVSVLNASDDAALAGLGVAAVPIFADTLGSNPKVSGVLLAEKLPPSQIDTALLRRLGVIAAHLAPALAQARLTSVTGGAATGTLTEIQPQNLAQSLGGAIPTVRRWRMLRWLPASTPPAGGRDG
jgi:hypothetical protein